MKDLTHESIYIPPLSPACELCAQGAKLVLLITGICPASCYYCPLSNRKSGTDVIFADEWQLEQENDINVILQEAAFIEAKGAGITGGDPFSVWQRTKKYVTLLKNTFGDSFHIHLYTSGLINQNRVKEIINAGVDEIRFHPEPYYWDHIEKSPLFQALKQAIDTNADVAFEIPAIPQMEQEILSLIHWAETENMQWVNLNELEFSERNELSLYKKGFVTKNDISASVLGSQETAIKVISEVHQKEGSIGVHYCSSSFKDGVQLKNRIKRRARNIALPFDCITEEGTILKGIIEPDTPSSLLLIETQLKEQYNFQTPKDYIVNPQKNRIELHIDFIEEIAKNISVPNTQYAIIEEYPTADHLEVERIPIN